MRGFLTGVLGLIAATAILSAIVLRFRLYGEIVGRKGIDRILTNVMWTSELTERGKRLQGWLYACFGLAIVSMAMCAALATGWR